MDNFGKTDYAIPPGVNVNDYTFWYITSPFNYRFESFSGPYIPRNVLYPVCYKKMYLGSYDYTYELTSAEYPPVSNQSSFSCTYKTTLNTGEIRTNVIGWEIANPAKPRYTDFTFTPFTDAQWLEATTRFANENPQQAIDAIAASGQPVEYDVLDTRILKSPMVSPSVQQSKTVTSEPDGSTKTAITSGQSSLTMTPQGQINVEDKLTTTTTSTFPDGSTSTSTSETTTNPSPGTEYPTVPEEQPVLPADPEMPTVPELYKQKYEDGLTGVWNDKKDEFMNSDFIQSIKSMAPDGLDSGSCPTWTLGFDMGIANYGEQTLPFPCWLVPFLKAVVMLTAAFTARKIIWG
jgi:hypothetical protein